MVTLLIGHRGVGKSTALKCIADHGLRVVDLDREIERRLGATIDELFARGESFFREIEERVLFALLEELDLPVVCALGAGYSGDLPMNAEVLWLRRAGDSGGRVFMDRPRLNASLSPRAEYMERFLERDARYRFWATDELYLPEGDSPMAGLFASGSFQVPFDLTVMPEAAADWDSFWERRAGWGIRRLEVRDDLLSADRIARIAAVVGPQRLLYACRTGRGEPIPGAPVDWALELGAPPPRAAIVSLHTRRSSFAAALEELSRHTGVLKLAVEVRTFAELLEGHRWWLRDPSSRAFLPRSATGRWRWYRSLFGPRMPVHFFREGEGSGLDQPFLWQCLLQTPLIQNFAAVLGSPVELSRTPMEQREFFGRRGWPCVAIEVREDEAADAWPVLRELGLRAAAVTAPLKIAAMSWADAVSAEARASGSLNTLAVDRSGRVSGHNTDLLALCELRHGMPEYQNVWLWGGGGVKASVLAAWPEARAISARAGLPQDQPEVSPDLLIWAVGRGRAFVWPPEWVRPKLVLDLNYTEDSPGREWAVQRGLAYQSGLAMFNSQARHQREFWNRMGNGECAEISSVDSSV